MNKKGFTLVEILSTIVLIALLLGLGIPGVMKISDNMKKRAYNTKVDLIEQAGILWGQDNKTRLQSNNCTIESENYKCKKITVEELIELDYLDSENQESISYKNPETDIEMLYNYIYIYKKNNRVYAKYNNEDVFYTLYADDNVVSDGIHYKNTFKIFASGLGNITYSWNGTNYESYPSSGIEVTRAYNNKTVYVKFKEGIKEKNLQYNVKIDVENPIAQITGITYNTFTSVATLNLSASDNEGIVEYKITKGSCDSPDGYKTWNNLTSYTFSNASEQNGEFRFCVKDQNGNIGESNSQYVANCAIQAVYTCREKAKSYWPHVYSADDYDFWITSFNSQNLSVIFKTSVLDELLGDVGDYTETVGNGHTPFADSEQHWVWTYNKSCLGSLDVEVKTGGTLCYNMTIGRS